MSIHFNSYTNLSALHTVSVAWSFLTIIIMLWIDVGTSTLPKAPIPLLDHTAPFHINNISRIKKLALGKLHPASARQQSHEIHRIPVII